jgi:hypothetical protein
MLACGTFGAGLNCSESGDCRGHPAVGRDLAGPRAARPVAALPSALALAAGSEVRAAQVIAWHANAMTTASQAAS